MRTSYRIIPIYTADVSGVCSALYELGGMTVMHDPSGCNSTYNTHDEIRWYDHDSLIFISGLTEIDAIMGNDKKFIRDVVHAAQELKPKFIALAGSPIPFISGTDFPALARIIEAETGIPTFTVPTNGMHDYVYGAGIALEELARRFVLPDAKKQNAEEIVGEAVPVADISGLNRKKTDRMSTGRAHEVPGCEIRMESGVPEHCIAETAPKHRARTVNLLGVTPLDFGPLETVDRLKENLQQYGWHVLSTWAMGDDLNTLCRAGEATVNLVVSAVGLRTAKLLQDAFQTPYVIGTPVSSGLEPFPCSFAESIAEALEKAQNRETPAPESRPGKAQNGASDPELEKTFTDGAATHFRKNKTGSEAAVYLQNRLPSPAEITLIGEPVTMGSMAAAIEQTYGRSARVLCPLKDCEELLGEKDKAVYGEEAMEEALKDAQIIIADPLYRPICPPDSNFYGFPHIAFSGRMFLNELKW